MTDDSTTPARRLSGDDAIEAADVRAGSTRHLNIADVAPLPVPADTANLRLGPDLHPDCLSLLPLVGVWRGTGTYGNETRGADSPAADFGQQITVSHDGRPFLKFESVSWNLTAGAPGSGSGSGSGSGVADSGVADSGATDSEDADSGVAGSGATDSEDADSGVAGSGDVRSEGSGDAEGSGDTGSGPGDAGSRGSRHGCAATGAVGAIPSPTPSPTASTAPSPTPGAREIGWLRPQPDGAIELLLAHAEGRIEVFYGRPRSVASWALSTDAVWRTPTALPVVGATRLYGVTPDGRLAYVEERAHTDAALAPHASALLTRLTG